MPRKTYMPGTREYKFLLTKVEKTPQEKRLKNTYPHIFESAIRCVDCPDVNLDKVSYGSKLVVLWKCGCGNTFESPINKRVVFNRVLCKPCSQRQSRIEQMMRIPQEDTLKTKRPDLFKYLIESAEYPEIDIAKVGCGSTADFIWACDCGNKYKSSVYNRVTVGESRCSDCAETTFNLVPSNNNLIINYPWLVAYAVANMSQPSVDVSLLSVTSKATLKWRCACGQNFNKGIQEIITKGQVVCRKCDPSVQALNASNSVAIRKSNIEKIENTPPEKLLKILYPEIFGQLLSCVKYPEVDIDSTSTSTSNQYLWKCIKCSNSFKNSVSNQVKTKQVICKDCRKTPLSEEEQKHKKITRMEQNPKSETLKDSFPELFKQAVRCVDLPNLDISKLSRGSTAKLEWECKCGNLFTSQVSTRVTATYPRLCPACTRREIHLTKRVNLPNERKLRISHPHLFANIVRPLKVGTDIENIASYSSEQLEWRCNCGNTFTSSVQKRATANNTHCKSCRRNGKSLFEFQIKELLELSLGLPVLTHISQNNLPPVDLYIPKYDIALQLDPYWSHKNRYDADTRIRRKQQEHFTLLLNFREEPLKQLLGVDNIYNIQPGTSALKWYIQVIAKLPIPNRELDKDEIKKALDDASTLWDYSVTHREKNITSLPFFSEYVRNITRPRRQPYATPPTSRDVCIWRCAGGHEWEARISSRGRSKDSSCPKCKQLKTSLGARFPLTEIEFIKNLDSKVSPVEALVTNKDMCLWQCSRCSKRFKATFNARYRTYTRNSGHCSHENTVK